MAIIVWPVNAVAGAPAYSARDAREAQSVYLAGASAADPFGARSGVRPGTSTTTVTVASMAWTIAAHAGVLDLQTAVEAAPYPYAVNAVGGLPTGTVTAAHATLARVDIVWLRIDDPAEADGSTVPAVVAGYTAGTAASTPAAPATPARCMVLAWVNVPASGGGAPTVTWVAPYAVAAGVLDPAVTATGGVVGAIITAWVPFVTAPAVTGDGVKKFLITVAFKEAFSTVAGDTFRFQVVRAGAGVGIWQDVALTSTWGNGRTLSTFDTPPAGAAIYTGSAYRFGGTGTGSVNPSQIIVQQIA